MKKKQYQSRRGKYFMGFLPNEKFLKLTEKERKFYKFIEIIIGGCMKVKRR